MMTLLQRLLQTVTYTATLASVLVATPSYSKNDRPPVPFTDPQNISGWELIPGVSDEFNGKKLDKDKWIIQGENKHYENNFKGRAPSQFVPHAVSVDEGYFKITTRWEPEFDFLNETFGGHKYANITTGAIISKARFHYGYMETRSKAADGPISSAFWTTGKGGEIDVFEHWGDNPNNPDSAKRLHTSFHDWRDPKSKTWGKRIWTNDHKLDFRVADDFHIYGLEWDPEYLKIFVDGHLIRCITKTEMGDAWVANNEQKVWLDSEVFPWEGNPSKLSAKDYPAPGREYIVDYVRVWQRKSKGEGCPAPKNLISNAEFSDGLQDWTDDSGKAIVKRGKGYKDSKAAYLRIGTVLKQKVKIRPNTHYVLSAWIKTPGTNMKDIWHNAWLGVKGYGGKEINKKSFHNKYHYHGLQFTTADVEEVTIFVRNDWSNSPTYVDGLVLREAPKLGKD